MYLSTLLKKTNRLLLKRANELLKPHEINHAYTFILMELLNQDGLTQTELVQRIDVEQPTAVRTLDRMERDGFILRQPSPTDRRAVLIYLSEKGKQTESMLADNANRLNEHALQGFSEAEKNQLQGLIQRVLDNLKTELC
ncbi:MarR family transcriptional regulator [Legionella taurinensis]|uniref:MarR family transcriptional regulator n=1 Tax=Legionella taurinensis TaxID=70611 RepID=A0A3A5LBU0_9GAMM|nr:MarR family transcriptional regulator [Legionella taurinensis]MDX1838264.1 MarR family transcriptional regulator [Legionella taurinensis]PUT39244.1 MarR family transcriptional regulator [Legionella taurinensis]PUT40590.1 MarR family transcriptional regulator [Legionella taurinensis]PUT44010.1 MarR family transcriptional regulator [Legionella taurinensis]PUT46272.1 MarR family transcriptional regulator [Legionella taurinensis]